VARAGAFVSGLVLGLVLGTAILVSHAADPDPELQPSPQAIAHAAEVAGVDEIDLAGAVVTTHLEPFVYLHATGQLENPLPPLPPPVVVSPAAPASGVLSARVECIVAKESGGANIANTRGSGAVGVAQYMPSTFAAHAREMGHPEWSPWNPDQARAVAAHDLALGRRAQWSVGGC
jgi:hypothetical protein